MTEIAEACMEKDTCEPRLEIKQQVSSCELHSIVRLHRDSVWQSRAYWLPALLVRVMSLHTYIYQTRRCVCHTQRRV